MSLPSLNKVIIIIIVIKFFGECGLKLRGFLRKAIYGYATAGERCVEFIRYHESPNITVNLLAKVMTSLHVMLVEIQKT